MNFRSARNAATFVPPSPSSFTTVPAARGGLAAKKKPVQVLSLADLGVDAASVGLAGAATWVEDFAARPPRQAGVVVKDEGDGGSKAAGFLAERKFI